jgi:hypothetical protein
LEEEEEEEEEEDDDIEDAVDDDDKEDGDICELKRFCLVVGVVSFDGDFNPVVVVVAVE